MHAVPLNLTLYLVDCMGKWRASCIMPINRGKYKDAMKWQMIVKFLLI